MKRVLEKAFFFQLFSNLIGTPKAHKIFIDEFVRPDPHTRLLDIGCGCGDIVRFLNTGRYLGVDSNRDYIEKAQLNYGSKAEFLCQSIEDFRQDQASFDLVMTYGVLHHLDDDLVRTTMEKSTQLLEEGGRWVSLDPVLVEGQNPFARFLIRNDRGRFVRSAEGYLDLVRRYFREVSFVIRDDLLNVPYDILIIQATGPVRRVGD